MLQPIDPDRLRDARPAHPMRASIILVTAVAVLIVVLAVTSSLA
ncbi:MAG TPA: hypothetical protein VNQ33_00870 [Acidimicrobiales bacterium]|nr:hypothetical protein [Acidimicrobiales bacterium]